VAEASEKKVAMRDVPAAVQQAIKEQSKGATLKGVATEVENGKTNNAPCSNASLQNALMHQCRRAPMHHRSTSVVIVLMAIAFVVGSGSGNAQQPRGPGNPGAKWTDEQLRHAVAPARVGRKLTPRAWPNDARVAVCLSFDVDNESYLLAGGETSPTALSAADFGAETGLPRILNLLDRQQVPASFFIPAVSALLHPEMIPAILKAGRHEIGVHGWIHEYLPTIGGALEEERLLNQAIDYLTTA